MSNAFHQRIIDVVSQVSAHGLAQSALWVFHCEFVSGAGGHTFTRVLVTIRIIGAAIRAHWNASIGGTVSEVIICQTTIGKASIVHCIPIKSIGAFAHTTVVGQQCEEARRAIANTFTIDSLA